MIDYDQIPENNSGLANSFEMFEQFEQLEQQVAHANAIGAKPKPAADEIVVPVDEIVMPVPVPAETPDFDKEHEQEETKRFMDYVI